MESVRGHTQPSISREKGTGFMERWEETGFASYQDHFRYTGGSVLSYLGLVVVVVLVFSTLAKTSNMVP
jgi:hypothetical protein